MEEGFDELKESIFSKLMPMLDEYMLVKLKMQQLLNKGDQVPADLIMIKYKTVNEISAFLNETEPF